MKRMLTAALIVLVSALIIFSACSQPQPIIPETSPGYTVLPTPGPLLDAPSAHTAASPIQEEMPQKNRYSLINPDGDTVETRILPPEGYVRAETDGFGQFIREQPLLEDGSPILQYDGQPAAMQDMHVAVLSLDVGARDLQQCADAALRLRCEYLYSIGEYEKINYHLTNGDAFPYSAWREGYRLEVDGNKTRLVKKAGADGSYEAFRKYLDVLFNYASTRSLFPESTPVPLSEVQIGDIFIYAASPGHCVIVMDICVDENGKKALLLGQSNMPAQQIHILTEPGNENPWLYEEDILFPVSIAYWSFDVENLRRMP